MGKPIFSNDYHFYLKWIHTSIGGPSGTRYGLIGGFINDSRLEEKKISNSSLESHGSFIRNAWGEIDGKNEDRSDIDKLRKTVLILW